MGFFDDDYAFCMSECDRVECFRHWSHMKVGIYTMGLFKGTDVCPFGEKEEEERKSE